MSQCQPSMPSPTVLPDELIAGILSMLPVKSLVRLRCMSKSWNTLISDPTFVNTHLQRSKRNAHLTLKWEHMSSSDRENCSVSVVPFPVSRLLENSSTTVPDDPWYRWNEDCRICWVVGSCNGLLCLLFLSFAGPTNWLRFWNPATGIRSEQLGHISCPYANPFNFSFGYDNSTGTYKVVMFDVERGKAGEASWRSKVRIFSLGDNVWRNIQSFPVVPLSSVENKNCGVHLRGTLNWLALRNYFGVGYYWDWKDITVEQFVIVSLDLSTETYTELLLPQGFDEVPCHQPTVLVLMDCLCLYHDFKGTDLVIWQMKEFGVQESWTQLLKISYQNLQIGDDFKFQLLPLCLTENGDTLILAHNEEGQAIIYNWRDNRVEGTRITNEIMWFNAKDYVESLVSIG